MNARLEYASGEFNHVNRVYGSRSATVDGLGVTGTVDYAMWANVISRLELRWDHANKNTWFLGELAKADSVGFYANLIYKF